MKRTVVAAGLTAALLAVPASMPAVAGSSSTSSDMVTASVRPATKPLDILLVNDDGWRGEGGSDTPLILALRDALTQAGHRVTVVAPATNQSGQGGRMSLPPFELTVANPERDVWTLTGSPADTIFFAMDEVLQGDRPDLVISGINEGANSGQAVNHSGTVNAAATALTFDIPAIAVSQETSSEWPEGLAASAPGAADYVVDLVRRIQRDAKGRSLMPADTMLNVNLPLRPGPADPATGKPDSVREAKGERITTLDSSLEFGFDYENTTGSAGGTGTYSIAFVPQTPRGAKGTDIAAVHDGYVSLTPMETDRDVDRSTTRWLRSLLRG